jgi:hypothetical protein
VARPAERNRRAVSNVLLIVAVRVQQIASVAMKKNRKAS